MLLASISNYYLEPIAKYLQNVVHVFGLSKNIYLAVVFLYFEFANLMDYDVIRSKSKKVFKKDLELKFAQSAGAVEYTDYTSAEE